MRTLRALVFLRTEENIVNWHGDIMLLERQPDGSVKRVVSGIAAINKILSERQVSAEALRKRQR